MSARLCIGTVQFGIDYGVQGATKPSLAAAVAMLDFATQNGVDAIDTADDYGNAEEVVGAFVAQKTLPRDRYEVITKFGTKALAGLSSAAVSAKLLESAEGSLRRLHTDYLDAYICHDPNAAGDAGVLAAMQAVKAKGLVRKIGFSVYESEEAIACSECAGTDFVQGPFSILDQRLKSSGALAKCAAKGIDIHTRSAFVQGLMLMAVAAIPERLANTRPFVERLERRCREAGLTRRELALAYVRSQPEISHLLFGVDNLTQLKEIVVDWQREIPPATIAGIADEFTELDQSIFMPNKWAKS